MADALQRLVETSEPEPRTLRVGELPQDVCVLLLGDPGSGKTTCLTAAAEASGGGFVSVRNFLIRPTGRAPEGATLFLDALDEALAAGVATPLDAVATHLAQLGSPRFWLSCRPVDWHTIAGHPVLKDCAAQFGLIVARLLPMGRQQIAAMVEARGLTPQLFFRQVEEARLDPLLGNPQTLGLLLDLAMSGQGLPTSKRAFYEKATELLAREARKDRPRGNTLRPATGEILDAAGEVFAALLLSGRSSVTLTVPDPARDAAVSIEDLVTNAERRLVVEAALETRLFAMAGEGNWAPQHRTVAEFVAACTLANRVASGRLPLARVVSLICGIHDTPHVALRGLFAWFVTLLPAHAEGLVALDPYGVLAYGDAASFPPATRRALLAGLQDLAVRDPHFRAGHGGEARHWSEARFDALAVPELSDELRAVLETRPWPVHLASCVLEGLAQGEPRSELVPTLVACLTDPILPAEYRTAIIPALVQAASADFTPAVDAFRRLLTELDLDPACTLSVRLLLRLYPRQVGLEDLAAFTERFVAPGHRPRDGDAVQVEMRLPNLVPIGEEAAVLDTWAAQSWIFGSRSALDRTESIARVALKLLTRIAPALPVYDAPRLVRWLLVVGRLVDRQQEAAELGAAFAARPDLLVPFLVALTESLPQRELRRATDGVHNLQRALPQWEWPPDAGQRLLDAALAEADAFRCMLLFHTACRVCMLRTDHFLFERVYAAAASRAALAYLLDPLCFSRVPNEASRWTREDARRSRLEQRYVKRARDRNVQRLRSELLQIANGTALDLLTWLGKVWFGVAGVQIQAEADPAERLLVETDPDIAAAAMQGFRALAAGGNLATPAQLAEQAIKGGLPNASFAWLAGADLLFSDADSGLPQLPPNRLANLLALAFTVETLTKTGNRIELDARPWRASIAAALPEASREAMRAFLLPQIAAGQDHVPGLEQLLDDKAYKRLRRDLLPELLRVASAGQVLGRLGQTALREMPPENLLLLIRKRLADAETHAERWPWLVLGWRLASEEFEDEVASMANENEALLTDLARSTGEIVWGDGGGAFPPLRVVHRVLLITLAAKAWPPAPMPEGVHNVPSPYELGQFAFDQMQRLAAMPEPEAGAALLKFVAEPSLHTYRDAILHLLEVRRREEIRQSWDTLSAAQVVATLRNGPPASRADLLSLVEDHLRGLNRELRTTEDNRWLGFWNTDEWGRATRGKVENVCRNYVATLLRSRFEAAGVLATTETRLAGEDRCDIVAQQLGSFLPIEVKCEWHADLWTAWREQLSDRYACHPKAGGLGIYLVLWFGPNMGSGRRRPSAPDGGSVQGSGDLEQRLRGLITSAGLPLRVVVLDVSPR